MLTASEVHVPSGAAGVAPLDWCVWLDRSPRPGWSNMAYDCALLDLAARGEATLRIYQWEPWCLSFGRHEPASRRYDRAAIAESGLDTVRRPTGGRAVWHAQELTYAVAAPASAFGDLARAYRLIHAMLQRAVESLGVRASLAGAPAAPLSLDAGACFAAPVGGEVVTSRGKLIGSAQLRQDGALLQHGSLLLAGNQDMVSAMALGDSSPVQSTTLTEALGRPVAFAEAADAIISAAGSWPGRWHELRTPSTECEGLAERHAARFRSPEWTWRR